MENLYERLLNNIIEYLINIDATKEPCWLRKVSTLIRFHKESLDTMGDISFPFHPLMWTNYLKKCGRELREDVFKMLQSKSFALGEESNSILLSRTHNWNLPVERLAINNDRCVIYLKRTPIIKQIIGEVLNEADYGHVQKLLHKNIYLVPLNENTENPNDLSQYRVVLLHRTLKNLLPYSKWNVISKQLDLKLKRDTLRVGIQSVADINNQQFEEKDTVVKCGLVTDPAYKRKLCKLSIKDYLSLRSNDMRLMALHKYGIRVQQDARFCALIERLGSAAATVDLLEVKHTNPVQIIRCGLGSSKGASFILYNSARLETLLRRFERRVLDGYYEALPEFEQIKWELLNTEHEWQLVYVYLIGFPDLIERCLEQIEEGICAVHLIIKFLQGLVAVFSIYYHKTRILMDKRDHLMDYVHARIYLIKAVREILNKTLALLDIQPVEFM